MIHVDLKYKKNNYAKHLVKRDAKKRYNSMSPKGRRRIHLFFGIVVLFLLGILVQNVGFVATFWIGTILGTSVYVHWLLGIVILCLLVPQKEKKDDQ